MSISNQTQKNLTWRLTGHSGLIIILGIILIAGLWLFVWRQVNVEYNRSIEESSQETMNLAIGFEEHVRRIVADADKSLLKLRTVYEREGISSQAVNDLLSIEGRDPSGAQVAIDNEMGRVLIAFDTRAIGNDISDREYFQLQRSAATDTLGIGKPVAGKAGGEIAIPITRRINRQDGSFAGIAMIALKADYFLEFYKKINLGQHQLISLVGLAGIVRARRADDKFDFGQNITGSELMKNVQVASNGTYRSINIVDGTDRIMSYRVMPDYPLVIAVGKSAQVALADSQQRKQNYILGAFLISLFILYFSVLLINKHEKLRQQNEQLEAAEEELLAHNEELQAKEEELLAQNEELQTKEEALLSNQERYQALIRQSSDAIIIYEYPTFNVVEVNPSAAIMFGYTEEELLSMNVTDLRAAGKDAIYTTLHTMKEIKRLLPAVRTFRHKDGKILYAERAGSYIEYQGKQLALFSYRDITEERKFQEQIRVDVELAGMVQKAMLPGDYEDEKVTIKTIYEPFQLISGDYYGYKWVRSGNLLNGFVLDVTGHGMATALQTAAVSAVLHEEIEKDHPWSIKSLDLLNSQFAAYLPENSFAAVLAFSFDFDKRVLTCISAGINYFLAASQKHNGWVAVPGSFLGNPDFGSFDSMTIPLQHGDVFCFVTDGLYKSLVPKKTFALYDFAGIFQNMCGRATREDKTDDCTVLCL